MLETRFIPTATGACQYPLLTKSLILSGRRYEKSHEIVCRDQVRYSYVTFNERVARLANVLNEAEVKAGDAVAVMGWDGHRYLEYMFTIPMIGAVLHTISVRLSPEQILCTMNHARDRFVLVNSEFVPPYRVVAKQLATTKQTILLIDSAEKSAELPDLIGEYELLLAAASPCYDFPDFDENSIATTFYTADTTGNPRGVYFSRWQLALHTLTMALTISSLDNIRPLGTSDVYMPVTPIFYVYARGTPYAVTMLGVRQVYPGHYDPELLVELWERKKVTFSHCVPTILQIMINARTAQGVDFKGWKMVIDGSALSRSLYEAAKTHGIQLTTAYGMSRTCPLISCTYPDDELLAGSEDERTAYRIEAGVPVPLVDVVIMDEQGRFLPTDDESQGELVLRSPWLIQGYFREPERGEELWHGGWIHAGDVATLDSMGSIEIRNHIKNMIKTGGEWLSSLKLEDLVSRHPAIREVVVVRVPDPQWGECSFALLIVREGQQLDVYGPEGHLKLFVEQGNIDKWAIPSQIAVVIDILKTSVGKPDKKHIHIGIAQWQEAGSAFLSTV